MHNVFFQSKSLIYARGGVSVLFHKLTVNVTENKTKCAALPSTLGCTVELQLLVEGSMQRSDFTGYNMDP